MRTVGVHPGQSNKAESRSNPGGAAVTDIGVCGVMLLTGPGDYGYGSPLMFA